MFAKLQDFFLNKALGRVAVRVGVGVATYLASGVLGASVDIDPAQLTALLLVGVNALISFLKPRIKALEAVKPIVVPAEAPKA